MADVGPEGETKREERCAGSAMGHRVIWQAETSVDLSHDMACLKHVFNGKYVNANVKVTKDIK